MAVGLFLFTMLGRSAMFADLMPGFLLFGAGAGLMNVPLTNAILAGHAGRALGDRLRAAQRLA